MSDKKQRFIYQKAFLHRRGCFQGFFTYIKMKEKMPNEDYVTKDITENLDATILFKNLSTDKIESVKEMVRDIEVMMANRKELNKEIIAHLDKVNLSLDNSILDLRSAMNNTNITNSGEVIKALSELRKEKVQLEELKSAEKLNFWRDIAMLKKELREHVKELREKESKSDLIDNLLEE